MFESIYIEGVELKLKRVVIAEDNPTVIFLHDSLGCIELWRNFPDKLASLTQCNVLLYDRQDYAIDLRQTTILIIRALYN